MKSSIKCIYILLLIMTFSPAITFAAEIIIKVTDENEPVVMAEIILINSTTRNPINSDFTNKSGVYRYSVKPGIYDVIVSKETFSNVTIKNIDINKSNVKKNVALIPAAFSKEEDSSDECE